MKGDTMENTQQSFTLTHRQYTGLEDLRAMQAILSAGRLLKPASGPHTGELEWWFFYGDADTNLNERNRLWYADSSETPIAWTFSSQEKLDFEFAVLPDWETSAVIEEIIDRMEAYLTDHAATMPPLEDGGVRKLMSYAYADDIARITALESRGYTTEPFLTCFRRDLNKELPEIVLPDGFTFLDVMRDDLADGRAEAHFSAFSPGSKMTGARYRHFMTAPSYNPETDIVVLNAAGVPVAYAMCWLDHDSEVGIFEPVGTHQDYHRKGLGRATMREGMRRMKERGMRVATVGTGAKSEDNIAFYLNAGFERVNDIMKFVKPLAQ
jgi:GNAT superfamily N-acetyltransferase